MSSDIPSGVSELHRSARQKVMAKTYHCWKCGIPVPMLTEAEWAIVAPLLRVDTERVKEIRGEQGISLKDALGIYHSEACAKYQEITGFAESNWNAIWHHRLEIYGPECPDCGHLLRTKDARFCANCGRRKAAEPSATDNPDDAQRLREDH